MSDEYDHECVGTTEKTRKGSPIIRWRDGETRFSNLDYQQHLAYDVLCPNGHFIQVTTRPEKWKRKNIVCRRDPRTERALSEEQKQAIESENLEKGETGE